MTRFKQTEIGEIPEDWEITELGSTVEFIRNGTTANQNENSGTPSKRVTRIETISDAQVNLSKTGLIKSFEGLERFRIQRGDILFSHINSVQHIGKVALFDSDEELYHGMNLFLIRPSISIDSSFLFYVLSSYRAKKYYEARCKQAVNQASLNKGEVSSLKLAKPLLPEQQKITKVLSCIDSTIQQTNEVIAQARTLKKGLMQELLTRGIEHKKFKQTEIGEIPEGWEICSVGDLIKLEYGKALKGENRQGGQFQVYGSNGVVGYHDESLVHGPGILVGRKGSVGAVHYSSADFWPIDTTYYVSFKQEINPKWMYYLLSSLRLEHLNDLGNVPGLNRNHVHEKLISKPPTLEQNQIDTILSLLDVRINNELEKLSQLELLKKGLMQDLLTGRVRFPEFIKGASS